MSRRKRYDLSGTQRRKHGKSGKYNEIDGLGTIEEVHDKIRELMDRF